MSTDKTLGSKTSEGLFAIACFAADKSVGEIPFAGSAVNFVCDRVKARDRYIELHPIVMNIIKLTGRQSKESEFLLNELEQTASYGAQRLNFHRYYIENKEGWKNLPPSPDDIMYGFW